MSDQKPDRVLELIRSMPSLGDIFSFGKLAKFFRAIALWRKQRKLRKALRQDQHRRFLLETLEPRLLLSADTYGFSAAALSGDHVGASEPPHTLRAEMTCPYSNVLES